MLADDTVAMLLPVGGTFSENTISPLKLASFNPSRFNRVSSTESQYILNLFLIIGVSVFDDDKKATAFSFAVGGDTNIMLMMV